MSFSITINGGGPIGNIVVAGNGGNFIRGFVANPHTNLPLKSDGHLDVGKGVGKDGFLTLIQDYGLKEPYMGKVPLVSGEIAEDFAQYIYKSDGVKNAVALGALMKKNGCVGAGGVIVELLPQAEDDAIFMIEDVMKNFTHISSVIEKMGAEKLFDFYFGHLNAEKFAPEDVVLRCNCSQSRIEDVIVGLGQKEAMDIVNKVGKIEIACQFCNKKYSYDKVEVQKLWQK